MRKVIRVICVLIGVICLLVGGSIVGYVLRDKGRIAVSSVKGLEIVNKFEVDLNIGISEDLLAKLREAFKNEDVVGFIHFESAGISYPIVQGRDNDEYLHTDVYGNSSVAGSIFLDSDNKSDFTDTASIIYGHHMRNGSMFGSLEDSLKGGIENKTFCIYTRDRKINYKVISTTVINPNERDSFLIQDDVRSPEDFLEGLKGRSIYYSEPGKDSKQFVTLLTCHYLSKQNTVRYGAIGVVNSVEYYELYENER